MGCVVGTPVASTGTSRGGGQSHHDYPMGGDYSQAPTHAEKTAAGSPLPHPLPSAQYSQMDNSPYKVTDEGPSGSEEKTSTSADMTTQPHNVAAARRSKSKRQFPTSITAGAESANTGEGGAAHAGKVGYDGLEGNGGVAGTGSSGVTVTMSADTDTSATSGASNRLAGRQSRLSLHGSPFPGSPTKQQRLLSLGSGLAHTASASASGLAAMAGSDGTGSGKASSLHANNANSHSTYSNHNNTTTNMAAANSITFASHTNTTNNANMNSSSYAAIAAAGTRPQLPQYNQPPNHRLSSTVSTSNQNHTMRESMLSDISTTLSTISATAASAPELLSPNHGSAVGGRNSIKNGLFRNGEDLEAQRQQAPLSIEEDLFIYDDIVISKDEARTKHWRLAGRKPAMNLESAATDSGASKPNSRSNSLKGKNFFTFNDFDVCVDEMDWMPATAGAATSIAPLQQQPWGESTTTNPEMKSMTTTSTVATVPNTVAHLEAQARVTNPKSNRPLRDFQMTSVLGHATRVKCIALSPAEKDFASCSNEDASISLNNLGVKSEVGIFTGHQDTIINATFSPDGKYLATTSKDKTMILWDVMTTKNLLTFTHPKVVICCCFGPDSKYLVSGCQDRVCRLWDTKRGKEWLSYTGHDGIIIAIAFSPDGSYVCSASADKTLRVWSATTAKTRFHLTGHTGIILSCSYTADGRHIVSNDESLLCVWSAEDGSCLLSLSPADVAKTTLLGTRGPKLGWTLSCAAPGAFTNYMLVACNNRFVYVLDIETGAEVTSAFCKAPVYCLTAGSYEKLACGDSFGNIYVLTMK